MGKISPRVLQEKERTKIQKELSKIFMALGKCNDFSLLANLLTESERLMIVRRVQIAKCLIMGMTVTEIERKLDVGQSTINTIERWLRTNFADYRSVLFSVYEDVRRDTKKRHDVIMHSFGWLRKKYPLHFLIFSLVIDDMERSGIKKNTKKNKK